VDFPNIVLILADDMGHGHVSSLNPTAKFQTPHIDGLAKQGISFSDAHSGSSVCSPTRYGILTGRYAWRTKLVRGVLGPYDPPLIEAGRLTLPGMLKQQGYHTACIGKWHLGWDWPAKKGDAPDFTQPIAGGPTTRGFEYYFGTDVPNYPPYCFIENDRTVGQPTAEKTERNLNGRPGPMLPGWRFEDILPKLAEKAVGYIEGRSKEKRPYFLYLPLTSPHEPIAPSAKFKGQSGLGDLADFLIETDDVVGQVVAAVDRSEAAQRTLVIFTCDNGSSLYTGGAALEKQGHRVSAGFRGAKGSIYEGGHRVPFIARWPGKIQPASKCDQTICLTDMMATLATVSGAKLPDNAAEDSFNVWPLLQGYPLTSPRAPVVHQSSTGRVAIRQGPWKLMLPAAVVPANRPQKGVAPKDAGAEPTERELYNLVEDSAEKQNVIAEHKDTENELVTLFLKFKKEGRSRPSEMQP
jgi:arylsulfatase A-like enzyme